MNYELGIGQVTELYGDEQGTGKKLI